VIDGTKRVASLNDDNDIDLATNAQGALVADRSGEHRDDRASG
jgi:hypothetical protein